MTGRLRLPKGAKPSKVTSTDRTRPHLTCAWIALNDEGAALFASDSYRLVRVPITVTGGEPVEGFVPRAALAAAEKTGEFEVSAEYVEPLHKGQRDGLLFRRPQTAETLSRVDCEKGLDRPSWVDLAWPAEPKPKDRFTVGVNARFLFEVAQALSASHDSVKLTFDMSLADPDDNGSRVWLKPILVEPNGQDGPRGMLMPVRVT